MKTPPYTGKSSRLPEPDLIRGCAIVLMVIFHFSFNLGFFGFCRIYIQDPFWVWFRFVIVTLFLLTSGISMVLATRRGIVWKSYLKRVGQVVAGAAAVTAVTKVLFPEAWIYFGVLHLIALSMLTGLIWIRTPRLALLSGLAIFALFLGTDFFNLQFLYLWLAPVLHLPEGTHDLARFIPWFGMVLIGIFLGHRLVHDDGSFSPALPTRLTHHPLIRGLTWMGRHALLIYLLHQVLLFGMMAATRWALNAF